MERTASHIAGSPALERKEISDYFFDTCRIENEVYCILRYHDAISQMNFRRTRRISISA